MRRRGGNRYKRGGGYRNYNNYNNNYKNYNNNYNNNYYNNNDNYYNNNYNDNYYPENKKYQNNNNNNRQKYKEIDIEDAPEEVYKEMQGKNVKLKEVEVSDNQFFKDDLLDDINDPYMPSDKQIKEQLENDIKEEYYDDDELEDNYGNYDNLDDQSYPSYDYNYNQDDTTSASSSTTKKQAPKDYSNQKFKNPLTFLNDSGFTQKVEKLLYGSNSYYHQGITDNFVNVLMIAEKPSIAKMITEVLSNGKYSKKNIGRGKVLLTFDGYFQGARAKFTVSSVAGHVYTSDFLKEHNRWDAIDPADLYEVPIVKLEAMKSQRMPGTLQKLGYGKDILCLWLDCDKEGENICYEVIYNVFPVMNQKKYQQIFRAKFSSLTRKDLKFAFDNLCDPPNKNESLSVDCRQVIDLKIGVSFTRFLTSTVMPGLDIQNQNNSNNNKPILLSYGPCQTPTLWFCVEREKEIKNFIPKEYFRPFINLEINKFRHKIKYHQDIYTKTEVTNLLNKIKGAKSATIKEVISTHNTKSSPVGMNTVNLLRTASSFLKLSPHNTMVIAEKLYTMGYITYPRTETTKYAGSFDFEGSLKNFKDHPVFGKNIQAVLKNYQRPILKGIDAGDHPPITPSKVATNQDLSGDYWKLYECICTHFFASLSKPCEYDDVTYKIDVNGVIFEENSTNITNEGYLLFLPHKKKGFEKSFPVLKKDQVFPIVGMNYDCNWTTPPGYLTESDLIKKMEENKIGTDASMPVHIENICQRNYVKVDPNRQLIPTKLGNALIEALGEIDPEIIHPDNRAKIEGFVDEVAHGKKEYDKVLKFALDLYRDKFINVRVNYEKLLTTFNKYFNVDTSKMNQAVKNVKAQNEKYKNEVFVQKKESEINSGLGKCNECKNGTMYIEYDKFDKYCVFCSNCKRRTKLIRDATKMEVKKDDKCDKCGACLVYVEVEDPFLNGDKFCTGCVFCDKKLK